MESLTKQQASEWCRTRGIGLDDRGRPRPGGVVEEFETPGDSGRRIALVAGHLQAFQGAHEILAL